uniref:Uncharacterized protein n=1 Tax=Arundo donax TaxID=35708 RepID=A0A0A9BGP7_ARUDO
MPNMILFSNWLMQREISSGPKAYSSCFIF